MSMKRLDNLCIYYLFKRCDFDYFLEKPVDFKISFYCLTDKFLSGTCQKVFIFCNCLMWAHKSELKNFCDWRLFYRDMFIYSHEFNSKYF